MNRYTPKAQRDARLRQREFLAVVERVRKQRWEYLASTQTVDLTVRLPQLHMSYRFQACYFDGEPGERVTFMASSAEELLPEFSIGRNQ